MEKAGSTETEALIGAMKGLELDTPFGPIVYRAADQQSTMGTFVGRTTIKDGVGAMKDWRFLDGAKYLPSEEEAAKLRPSEG
jgi:branched-chain amino acid transport system substrate-binding protein